MARVIENDRPTQLVHVPRVTVSDSGDDSAASTREGYYKTAALIAQSLDEYELALSEAVQRMGSAKAAVDALEAAARGKSGLEDEALARIGLAVQALATAREALALH